MELSIHNLLGDKYEFAPNDLAEYLPDSLQSLRIRTYWKKRLKRALILPALEAVVESRTRGRLSKLKSIGVDWPFPYIPLVGGGTRKYSLSHDGLEELESLYDLCKHHGIQLQHFDE